MDLPDDPGKRMRHVVQLCRHDRTMDERCRACLGPEDWRIVTTIVLPCYGIVVTLGPIDEEAITPRYTSGAIESTQLKHPPTCILTGADGESADDCTTHEHEPDEYNAAVDALESLILAHAVAGVDVDSNAYVEGIETSVEAIANNLT